jgi:UDP-glucose 4-epimerase
MKYLVTGAAGFIGSSMVDRLLSEGHQVVGVDNFSTGLPEFLLEQSQNINFNLIEGDLLSPGLLSPKLLESVDAVFHFAANADIRGGLSDPKKDLEQNTIVTLNLLEAMRGANISRIIFASTAAALGEPDIFPTPENVAIPNQTSLYGASKMACEGLISSYCQGYGFEGYVFRFVSLLGPRYPHGHVFDFIKSLRKDPSRLPILGDGNQRKSYLHIKDCLDAVLRVSIEKRTALSKESKYEVYHLGLPEYCFVRESAGWICDELGLAPRFEYAGGNRGWIGDNPFVFLDVRKVMSEGWTPKYSIESSVRETVRWLTDNAWIFDRR